MISPIYDGIEQPVIESRSKKKKKRAYWLALIGLLLDSVQGEIHAHVLGFANNLTTPGQFGAAMITTLSYAHAQAYVYGYGLTGSTVLTINQANQAVRGTMQAQVQFLQGFIEDLEERDPRYVAEPEKPSRPVALLDRPEEETEWDMAPILTRARMYAERLRGTAGQAAVDALPETAIIEWRLGPNEDHCEDCPKWSAEGPYDKYSLPAIPGDGLSQCRVNCLCSLWSDGVQISS